MRGRLINLVDIVGETRNSGEASEVSEVIARSFCGSRVVRAVPATGHPTGPQPTAPPPMNAGVGLSARRGLRRGEIPAAPLITNQANARVGDGPSSLALRPPGPVPMPAGQLRVSDGNAEVH